MATGLANWLGRNLLSFQNGRVVAPPGLLAPNGGRPILVATPMRAGTHILIDLLLNNLPAYRRTPLYADLDQFVRRARGGKHAPVDPQALQGYVVKTHFPTGIRETEDEAAHVRLVAAGAVVLTVDRPIAEIKASLARWSDDAPGSVRVQRLQDEIDVRVPRFREFWRDRADLALDFRALFDEARMIAALDRVAALAGVARSAAYTGPMAPDRLTRIYVDKGLTRLFGARAPRVDTTIHTLKRRAPAR